MQINNNSRTNFGMAYKMTNVPVASRKIAEKIGTYNNPDAVEKYFTEMLVKPIKGLKTVVSTDGDKVIIEHPVTKIKFEVLDSPAWAEPTSNGKVINYNVVPDGTQDGQHTHISVCYPETQNRIGSIVWDSGVGVHRGIIRKHINALEIAKRFDADLAQQTAKDDKNAALGKAVDEMSSRLAGLSD